MTQVPAGQGAARQHGNAQRRTRTGAGKVPSVYLWNPTLTVVFSLVLTPVFGALIQMLNWRILKKDHDAQHSLWWCLAGCVILLGNQVFSALLQDDRVVDTFTVSLLVLYGCSWFLLSGRRQIRYVREHFSRSYGRKSWKAVLPATLAAYVLYVLLGFALTYLADIFH